MKGLPSRLFLTVMCAALSVTSPAVRAQAAPSAPVVRSIDVGEAVDTANASVHEIVQLTRAYLADPGYAAIARGLWRGRTPLERRVGDLSVWLRNHTNQTLRIVAVNGEGRGDSVYSVKVLYPQLDSTLKPVSILALQHFIAIRNVNSPFGWQLVSPLPYVTRNWRRRTYGHLTFWYAPGQREHPGKAQQASAFVDSLAKAFHVPPPRNLDIFLTGSADEMYRLQGLDYWWVNSGPRAALTSLAFFKERIVLLGDADEGEDHRRELVRLVLHPQLVMRSFIMLEGTAAWLGGLPGRSTREMFARLVDYQNAHPTASAFTAMYEHFPGEKQIQLDAFNATMALIVQGVHARSGVVGLARLSAIGLDQDLTTKVIPYMLGIEPTALDAWWRSGAQAEAKRR